MKKLLIRLASAQPLNLRVNSEGNPFDWCKKAVLACLF
jgi:hypothetical protein